MRRASTSTSRTRSSVGVADDPRRFEGLRRNGAAGLIPAAPFFRSSGGPGSGRRLRRALQGPKPPATSQLSTAGGLWSPCDPPRPEAASDPTTLDGGRLVVALRRLCAPGGGGALTVGGSWSPTTLIRQQPRRSPRLAARGRPAIPTRQRWRSSPLPPRTPRSHRASGRIGPPVAADPRSHRAPGYIKPPVTSSLRLHRAPATSGRRFPRAAGYLEPPVTSDPGLYRAAAPAAVSSSWCSPGVKWGRVGRHHFGFYSAFFGRCPAGPPHAVCRMIQHQIGVLRATPDSPSFAEFSPCAPP